MNTLFNVISIFILFFVWLLSILICINYVKETSNLHINNDELDIESQYQTTQHN